MSEAVGSRTRGRSLTIERSRTLFYYSLLVPAFLLILAFMAYPFFDNVRLSFFRWDGFGKPQWLGLGNYLAVLQDQLFYKALWHSAVFSLAGTVGTVGLGFLVAVAVSRRVFGWRLFRFGYFIPVMISVVVTAALWVRLYEYDTGIINDLLEAVGLARVAWLGDVRYSLLAIILVGIWQFLGFPMIVILSGLENIPPDLHDAATIDGVNEVQRLAHVTVPLLRQVMVSITMLQLVLSLRAFDAIWIMTKGGPANSSEVLMSYLYKEGFQSYEFGFASSISILMFVLVFAIGYWYQRVINRGEVQY